MQEDLIRLMWEPEIRYVSGGHLSTMLKAEDYIRAIGAEPVLYAQRNECCGGYMAVENRSYAAKQAQKIMDNAKAQGAELLITACPLCSYNLLHNTDGALPVVYFTELLAEALGCGEEDA